MRIFAVSLKSHVLFSTLTNDKDRPVYFALSKYFQSIFHFINNSLMTATTLDSISKGSFCPNQYPNTFITRKNIPVSFPDFSLDNGLMLIAG